MDTCENCRFGRLYNGERMKDRYVCFAIRTDDGEREDVHIVMDDSQTGMYFRHDFGCNLFQDKKLNKPFPEEKDVPEGLEKKRLLTVDKRVGGLKDLIYPDDLYSCSPDSADYMDVYCIVENWDYENSRYLEPTLTHKWNVSTGKFEVI